MTEDVAWETVPRKDTVKVLAEGGPVRYNIDYKEILATVDAGNVVKVNLDHVSESALRQGIAYHSAYIGIIVHCRISDDRRSMYIFKQGVAS